MVAVILRMSISFGQMIFSYHYWNISFTDLIR